MRKLDLDDDALLGPAVTVISTLTGEEPSHAIGATYSERPAENEQ